MKTNILLMKRFLIFIFGLLLFPIISFASGKMMVGEGENVELQAQSDLPSPEYKWVVLQGDTILNSFFGQNFTRTFNETGEYTINLIVRSTTTNAVESSSLNLIVGKSINFPESLGIQVQSFPETSNNIISLPQEFHQVAFILSGSTGNIKEYRIDADTHKDSDGDGNPANDIDNVEDPSFHSGSLWTFSYASSKLPTTANISIIDENNESIEQSIAIERGTQITPAQKPKAIIETFPAAKDDKRIHLQGDATTLYIYSKNSPGNIIEYRIDTDIAIDSDGDGNTANDIDNLNHPSFYSGETFALGINRTEGERVIQLIVVSKDGKGSLIQRKVVWDSDAKLLGSGEFRLFVDKSSPFVGETVNFGLDGIDPKSTYDIKWDFNGDQNSDLQTDKGVASYIYEQEGTYEVLVQIKSLDKQILKYASIPLEVTAKATNLYTTKAPISNFTFTLDGGNAQFTNTSIIDPSVEKKGVQYEWKFGDGLKSSETHPKHSYQKEGTYIVRLRVTDSSGQFHEKQAVVEVQNISAVQTPTETPVEEVQEEPETPVTPAKETETPTTGNGGGFGNVLLYFFIGIISLIGIGILGIGMYLIIQKIKNPDYSFGEILEEEKEKILSILEGRPYEPPHGEIVATEKSVKQDVQGILKESETAEKIKQDINSSQEKNEKSPEKTQEAPAPMQDDNIPDWMKDTGGTQTTPPAVKEDAAVDWMQGDTPQAPETDVPDWLKGDSAPEAQQAPADTEEDIPDWLKGDVPPPPPSAPQAPQPPQGPQNPPAPPSPPMPPQTPPAPPSATPPAADDDDDIPDWLK